MFRWMKKNNWKRSSAHLLLLSKFRRGDSPERYRDAEYWADALKEPPIKAIDRFRKSGMVELAELPELLAYQFKIPDLKSLLRERGLKISGRKAELIYRLIEHDPKSMKEATKDLMVYRCTGEGLRLAEAFLADEKKKKQATEREAYCLLEQKQFPKAVRVVADYEASQVFPRGIGIDWNNYNVKSDVYSLKAIFEKTPKIITGIDKKQLKTLRLAAAMMQLWGTNTAKRWLPSDFETGIHLDGNAAARMLALHASHIRDMEGYKTAGVKTVKIMGANDERVCPECKKIQGTQYRLGNVPELPYANCTCEIGCRCFTIMGGFE